MTELKLTLTASLPERPDWIELSPDGRWAILRHGTDFQIIETMTGHESTAFSLPDRHSPVLSPDGRYVARMYHQQIIIIDSANGSQRSKVYPDTDGDSDWQDVCFTADNRHLWCTPLDSEGIGRLTLLDVETLQEIDAVPVPSDEQSTYGKGVTTWHVVSLAAHVPSDVLAITHQTGDKLLGVFFFRCEEDRIRPESYFISGENDIRPFTAAGRFSDDGRRFAAFDEPFLWIWQLPDLQLVGNGCRGLSQMLSRNVDEKTEDFTLIGEYAVVAIAYEDFPVEARVEELRIVEVASGSVVGRHILPRSFNVARWKSGGFLCAMRGKTMVGVSGNETLFYQIDLIPEA